METRQISLTLEKAKEWYNSGNEALREAALQAYTEDELKTVHFSEIKSFEDACKALNLCVKDVMYDLSRIHLFGRHLIAIYKLDIIRKALNGDWKSSLAEGKVYVPYVGFYLVGGKTREIAKNNGWKIGQAFCADGKNYYLVSGDYSVLNAGLGYFIHKGGSVYPNLGLLGCKSKEIAEHISTYFAKEIFEACYAQYIGIYTWV